MGHCNDVDKAKAEATQRRIGAARQRKVVALVAVLRDHAVTAGIAERLTEAQWSIIADFAGVREPSVVTTAAVVEEMRIQERYCAEMASRKATAASR